MKKIVLLLLILSGFYACKNDKKSTETPDDFQQEELMNKETDSVKTPILLGIHPIDVLKKESYSTWFIPAYDAYKPDEKIIEELKSHLKNEVTIKLYMGTWCEDSQREVPTFIKILDQSGFDKSKLTTIMLDEDKTSPAGLEKGMNITNVPTFVFYRNGQEINRIVEIPIETLEKDMFVILCGQFYRHAYDF
jgi:thiol-disulfide isomerase/thioredoxin